MNISDVMKERHSVRQYKDKAIENEKREILEKAIAQANAEAGLNIQIFFDEPTCFKSFMANYGKFEKVKNYISLVGSKSDKLEETLGYYGELLVLKAQELGLNTCWVALTHGKSKAVVNKGEKEVCIISLGYGETQGVAHKSKAVGEISNVTSDSPEWFSRGVDAALLAPTAMNQQKFYIEYRDDEAYASTKSGFYTKLDLGIVKYHFEVASGRKLHI